jgi:hypothetical protein
LTIKEIKGKRAKPFLEAAKMECELRITNLIRFCYNIAAMMPSALLVLLTLTGNLLLSKEFTVCIDDQSRMFLPDVTLFGRLLVSAAKVQGVTLSESCQPTDSIRLTIIEEPFPTEPMALGATRISGGRILPEIYLFRSAIRRALATGLPVLEIRAMVLVALHELQHFREQRLSHDPQGVFSSNLGRVQLLALSRDYR